MDIYSTANQMKLERKTIFDMPMRVTFIDHINADNSGSILDLKQQILNLIETVRGWTPDKSEPDTKSAQI